jgi:hypothetical protein
MGAKEEIEQILRENRTREDATAAIRRKRESLIVDPDKLAELDNFDAELEKALPSIRKLPKKQPAGPDATPCAEAMRRADAAWEAARDAENVARHAIDLAKTALNAVEMVASAKTRAKKDEIIAHLKEMIVAGQTRSRSAASSHSS